MKTKKEKSGASDASGRHGGGIVPAPPGSSSIDGHDRASPLGARFQATTTAGYVQEAGTSGISGGRSRGKARRSDPVAEQPANISPTGTPPRKRRGRITVRESDDSRTRAEHTAGEESGAGSEAASVAGKGHVPVELPRWGIPPMRREVEADEMARMTWDSLEDLGRLRVRPAYKTTPGVQIRDLCDQAREAYQGVEDGLGRLRTMAVEGWEGGLEQRMAGLEDQVRGLKAALARVERLLARMGGTAVRPAPPPASSSSLRPSGATKVVPRGGVEGRVGVMGPPADGTTWTQVVRRKGKSGRVAGVGVLPAPVPAPARMQGGSSAGGRTAAPTKRQGDGRASARPLKTIERQEVGGNPPTFKGQGGGAVQPQPQSKKGAKRQSRRRRAVPRTAAVTITATGDRSYAEIMKEARERVDLDDIGIGVQGGLTLKRARNGGYLLEIAGTDGPEKADRLARDLEDVLAGVALVARPVKSAELRVTGLDDSVTPAMVLRTVCAIGGCPPSAVRLGEIRRSVGGLGAIWVRCPLAAALKMDAARRVKVGWALAGVQLLEERPLQCYRCLEFGHLAAACKSTVVRKGRCFRCGGAGHDARGCTAKMRCILCVVAGRDPGHRLGGRACSAAQKGAGRRTAPVAQAEPQETRRQRRGADRAGRMEPPSAGGERGVSGADPAPDIALPPAGMGVEGEAQGAVSGWPPPPTGESAVSVIYVPDTQPPPSEVGEPMEGEEEAAIRDSGQFLADFGGLCDWVADSP